MEQMKRPNILKEESSPTVSSNISSLSSPPPPLQSSCLDGIIAAGDPPTWYDWQNLAPAADAGGSREESAPGQGQPVPCAAPHVVVDDEDMSGAAPSTDSSSQGQKASCYVPYGIIDDTGREPASSSPRGWLGGGQFPACSAQQEAVPRAQDVPSRCSKLTGPEGEGGGGARAGDTEEVKEKRQYNGCNGDKKGAHDEDEVDPLGLVAVLRERLQQMAADLERVKAAADRLHEQMEGPEESPAVQTWAVSPNWETTSAGDEEARRGSQKNASTNGRQGNPSHRLLQSADYKFEQPCEIFCDNFASHAKPAIRAASPEKLFSTEKRDKKSQCFAQQSKLPEASGLSELSPRFSEGTAVASEHIPTLSPDGASSVSSKVPEQCMRGSKERLVGHEIMFRLML